jgi:hypothetical protein
VEKWEDRLKRGFEMLIVPNAPLVMPEREEEPAKRRAGKRVAVICLVIAVALLPLFVFIRNALPPELVFTVTPPPPESIYTDVFSLFDIHRVPLPEGFRPVFGGIATDGETLLLTKQDGGFTELVSLETHRLTVTAVYQDFVIWIDCLYAIEDGEFIPVNNYQEHDKPVFYPQHSPDTNLVWGRIVNLNGLNPFVQYDIQAGKFLDLIGSTGLWDMADVRGRIISPDQSKVLIITSGQAFLYHTETTLLALLPLPDDGAVMDYSFIDEETVLLRIYDPKTRSMSYYIYSALTNTTTALTRANFNDHYRDGSHMFTWENGVYSVTDLKTGAGFTLGELPAPQNGTYTFSVSPDGKHIMVWQWSRSFGAPMVITAYFDVEKEELFLFDAVSLPYSHMAEWTADTLFDTGAREGGGTEWVFLKRKSP